MARQAKNQGDRAPLPVVEEGFFNAGAAPPPGWAVALREAFPMEVLGPATGTADRDLAVRLLLDVARGMSLFEGHPDEDEDPDRARQRREKADGAARWAVAAALAAMRAIGPRDGLEGMLAAQMVCVHAAAMDFTGRATRDGQPMAARAVYMRQAGQLMALFTRQMEVLERRRGAPPVSVGRVNVEAGGQAIVGTVTAGARDGVNGRITTEAQRHRETGVSAATRARPCRPRGQ